MDGQLAKFDLADLVGVIARIVKNHDGPGRSTPLRPSALSCPKLRFSAAEFAPANADANGVRTEKLPGVYRVTSLSHGSGPCIVTVTRMDGSGQDRRIPIHPTALSAWDDFAEAIQSASGGGVVVAQADARRGVHDRRLALGAAGRAGAHEQPREGRGPGKQRRHGLRPGDPGGDERRVRQALPRGPDRQPEPPIRPCSRRAPSGERSPPPSYRPSTTRPPGTGLARPCLPATRWATSLPSKRTRPRRRLGSPRRLQLLAASSAGRVALRDMGIDPDSVPTR